MPSKYSQRVKNKSPYTINGVPVAGVTTVLKIIDKSNYLVPWAAKLAFQGIDPIKYRDEKGMIGTLTHALVNGHLLGRSEDDSVSKYDYSQREIDLAGNSFRKWLCWEKQHTLEPILVEKPIVSEMYRFGGTPDYYGLVDGALTLADWKSGANLYPEMWYQMAGYGILLDELGHRIDQRILLNIGRDETENFIEAKRPGPPLEDEILIFRCCLDICEAKKRLKND